MTVTRGARQLTRHTVASSTAVVTRPRRAPTLSSAVTEDRSPVLAAAGNAYQGRQEGVPDFAMTPEQIEVDRYVDEIGWAGFYIQIKAMLGAMCPWVPMVREGRDWVVCEDPRIASIVDLIRPKTGSQAGLRFRSLRLQARIGEHAFWPDQDERRGLVFDIAHPEQLRKGQSVDTFGVATRRDAGPTAHSGYREISTNLLRRHFIPDDKWPDEAKASLAGILPELRVYRSTVRNILSGVDSRLLMNGLLYISSDAGGSDEGGPWVGDTSAAYASDPDDLTPSSPQGGGLDEVLREFARFGARAFRDTAGNDVASRLPFPFPHHTKPEMVDLGRAVDDTTMQLLTEIVLAGARGVNIPTQFLVMGEASANHWNDAELRRALHERAVFPELEASNEFWTEYAFRPLLALSRAGGRSIGDGDPDDYRLGCDTSVLDVRSDSLEAIKLAHSLGVADNNWLGEKLGVPQGNMLDVPINVTDYEHWLYSRASAGRANAEVIADFGDPLAPLPEPGPGPGDLDSDSDGAPITAAALDLIRRRRVR